MFPLILFNQSLAVLSYQCTSCISFLAEQFGVTLLLLKIVFPFVGHAKCCKVIEKEEKLFEISF